MNGLPSSNAKPTVARLSLPLTKPLLSWIVLALNIIVWLLMTLGGGSTDIRVLVHFGAKVPWLVAGGEYWRLFTAIFLHIGFLHLAFNSYALYSLGPQVETLYGRNRFLMIYLLSGLAGSVASYVLSASVSAGASGAIFGLVGALTVYLIRQRDILGRRGRRGLTCRRRYPVQSRSQLHRTWHRRSRSPRRVGRGADRRQVALPRLRDRVG